MSSREELNVSSLTIDQDTDFDLDSSLKGETAESEARIPFYLNKLLEMPLLSAEQESELIRRAKEGDEQARTRLVESNLRLVVSIAKQYSNPSMPLEDLIQEGVIGLLKALNRFDSKRGYRFSTYATHWIRQTIVRALDSTISAIRLPTHAVETLRRIEKQRALLKRQLGREPNLQEIAQALRLNPKKVERLLLLAREPLSLDQIVHPESNLPLIALLKDPCVQDPEEVALTQAWFAELDKAIQALSEREQWAIRKRIGLEDTEELPPPMAQLSRERLRQLEIQAFKKLRQWARKHQMNEWLGK